MQRALTTGWLYIANPANKSFSQRCKSISSHMVLKELKLLTSRYSYNCFLFEIVFLGSKCHIPLTITNLRSVIQRKRYLEVGWGGVGVRVEYTLENSVKMLYIGFLKYLILSLSIVGHKEGMSELDMCTTVKNLYNTSPVRGQRAVLSWQAVWQYLPKSQLYASIQQSHLQES